MTRCKPSMYRLDMRKVVYVACDVDIVYVYVTELQPLYAVTVIQ